MGRVIVVFICVALAGCVSRAGVEEFTVYKRAFDESRAVSAALIDRLAASERAAGRFSGFHPNELGVDEHFLPSEATYFSDHADPPLAAEYRRAMATINQYNELMLAYASGRGFDDVVMQVDLLASESANLAATLSGQTLALSAYSKVLNQIVSLGASERSRAVFQSKFIETKPALIALLNEMKAKTPDAFKNLTLLVEVDIRNINRGRKQGDIVALQAKHMEARVLLSNWIILLDRHADAIEATQRAIQNPRLGIVLSGTAEALVQLRMTLDSVRLHLAEAGAR